MLNFQNHLGRRVHISHQHGSLVVRIDRNNDRSTYVVLLLSFTTAFGFFCASFVPPMFRDPSGIVYVLPFVAFVVLWYIIGLRLSVWRLFGTEEVAVSTGVFRWTRTALFWVRTIEIPTANITEVEAITPWHALSNRVAFTAQGKRHHIGDMLLRDETSELANQLAHAVGLEFMHR